MKQPQALLLVGTRPNLIKIAPIAAALRRARRVDVQMVHTGQHYDENMSGVFFAELGIPPPDVTLGVGSGTQAIQVGATMEAVERLVNINRPDVLVTVGDVNSTLAGALVAVKAGIPQAHVEAGLRSGDASMPEEVNRVVTDRLADLLFTHSEEANENLRAEGVPEERIRFVGNVMIDTLLHQRPHWQGAGAQALRELPRPYGVLTLHRPSNVDDPKNLKDILKALADAAGDLGLIFPVHPRTRRTMPNALPPTLRVIPPIGYFAFMDIVEHARFVFTDSGGVQEETTILGVPCLTFRDNTERPVTVRHGTNQVIGSDPIGIAPALQKLLNTARRLSDPPPLWDGKAGERIARQLEEYLSHPLSLRLSS